MTVHPLRALPLRVSLVAAMLLLVGCGLLASGVAVTSILQHSLMSRVDERLVDASTGWARSRVRTCRPTRAESRAAAVELLRTGRRHPRRRVDGHQRPQGAAGAPRHQRRRPGSGDHRIDRRLAGALGAVSVHSAGGELITVAVDLSDVEATVRALVLLQLGIGSAVLLVLGVAGYWVVNRSLQPLVEVEDRGLDRRGTAGKPCAPG